MDVENAQLASPMWRAVIDASPEFAALRLARYDFASETSPPWLPYEDYELNRFFVNWSAIGSSWKLENPIASRRLRLAPIGALTNAELQALRTELQHPLNVRIELKEGEKILPAAGIWVTPYDRA